MNTHLVCNTGTSADDTTNLPAAVDEPLVYTHIATHFDPHADEYGTIWLLRNTPEAEERFPGIKTAEIVFWGLGSGTPDGRSPESWKQRGYFLLGVGGSEHDEHPANGLPRKKGASAISIVAEELGLSEEPWLKRIVELLTFEDLHARSGELSLMSLAKLLNVQNPDDYEAVMNWVMMGLGAKMRQQMQFHNATRDEFVTKAKTETINGPRGEKLTLVVVESDDSQMASYALSHIGGGAHVTVVKKSTGHVIIMTRKSRRLDLRDIIRILRTREMEVCNTSFNFSWRMLEDTEGTINVKGANRWHNFKEGRMIMNGSRTARDIEPTELPLAEIVRIVRLSLNDQAFPTDRKERAAHCQAGTCTSGDSKTCPWHDVGLVRCRVARHAMYVRKEERRGLPTGQGRRQEQPRARRTAEGGW